MSDGSSPSNTINIPGRQEEKFNPSKRKFNLLEEIWEDDVLDRKNIAASFTAFVSGAKTPLTISVNGEWGTGKSFLLQRWREELEFKGFEAIYFNAWEDDFCDDPLVAIIGQLAEPLSKYGFDRDKIQKCLTSILVSSGLNILNQVPGLKISKDDLEKLGNNVLKSYSEQAESKTELKKQLEKISEEVKEKTEQHPLVFIIDELDRCRPTFALELLERVKHIFNIPNMIFVFGINRRELCSSIKSVYGQIDDDTYFRRFFDFEFSLPGPNKGYFCKHLIEKYKLMEVRANFQMIFEDFLPKFYGRLGLSLRDMDDCMRVFVFVVEQKIKAKDKKYMRPYIFLAMIVLRLSNRTLYQQWITGRCNNQKVVEYFHEKFPEIEPGEEFYGFYEILNEVLNDSSFTIKDFYDLIELASSTPRK